MISYSSNGNRCAKILQKKDDLFVISQTFWLPISYVTDVICNWWKSWLSNNTVSRLLQSLLKTVDVVYPLKVMKKAYSKFVKNLSKLFLKQQIWTCTAISFSSCNQPNHNIARWVVIAIKIILCFYILRNIYRIL